MVKNIYKKMNKNRNVTENDVLAIASPQNTKTYSNITKKRIELEERVKKYKNKKRKIPQEDKNFFLNKSDDVNRESSLLQENVYVKFEKPKHKYRCVACKLIIRNKKLVLVCNDILPYINKFGKIQIVEQIQKLNNTSATTFDDIDVSTNDDNTSNNITNTSDSMDDNNHQFNLYEKTMNNDDDDGEDDNNNEKNGNLFKICSVCYLKIFKYNKEDKNNIDSNVNTVCANNKCRKMIYYDVYCLDHFLLHKYQD